ncbi:helix-turn-helix domain-containing protein [Ruegeria atlantica]|uniref:helix-turn-helix domain-containing protein n=1 Tax=Ruegeria atlantica TaxID=81569 RepID=UPI00147E3CDE
MKQKTNDSQPGYICTEHSSEVKIARLSLGLSQREMAPLLGLPLTAELSAIEYGKVEPHPSTIRLLQAYLDGYRPSDFPETHLSTNRKFSLYRSK